MDKEKRTYKQGFFVPKHPEKYIGDVKNIVYRSGWEKKVMTSLDENTAVLRWSSEEIVIPYVSPLGNPLEKRIHRYFPDFYVEAKERNGGIKKLLIEVKPHSQTIPPVKPKRRTKRFLSEMVTYSINQAKWDAAELFCQKHGWEFKVLTENEIFAKKNK